MRIGVDIGGNNMRLGIIDGGQIYKKTIVPTLANETGEVILNNLISSIRSIINSNIRGIGIGVPSIVDVDEGIINYAINIPSWRQLPLKDILEKEFKIPVYINNDSNCFAFAERYYGEGTIYRNIVCLVLGTGVGAGVIINSELYSGNSTGAGEVGSLPYKDHDYEYYCSGRFFIRHGITGKEAYQKALEGNTEMVKLWDEYGEYVGDLIKSILYVYDPQAIIIGGGISRAFEFFSDKMFESIDRFPYTETLKRIKILVSQKEDINLLGAAALVV